MGRLSTALVGDNLFDGSTYDAARDQVRLSRQLQNVKQILSDNRWHTLSEISQRIGGSEAGISMAQLTDAQAADIRRRYIWRKNAKDLATEYETSVGTIYAIVRGQTYKGAAWAP